MHHHALKGQSPESMLGMNESETVFTIHAQNPYSVRIYKGVIDRAHMIAMFLYLQSWYKTRRSVWWLISPGDTSKPKKVLFDR